MSIHAELYKPMYGHCKEEDSVDKTNVLIVTSSLHIGGLEMVIANLCRYINKENFNISVCCLKELGSIGRELINEGYSVCVLPKPGYIKNNYISWLHILKLVKEKNIHVLHSHTLDSLLDVALCRLFNRKIRAIHTFHYGNYPNLLRKYLYLERLCSRLVDQLVAVGNEQREKIIVALNIRRRAICTVWNGVPNLQVEKSASVVETYRRNGRVIVGTVCTLIEQKGLTHLIDVAYLLKQKGVEVLFLVAGEGHLRNELEEKTARLGLKEDVIFMGWVENAASSFIPYIDIFFLPSLWEAMSVVVLEAMAAGKPVVVTNVGENRHVILNENNGFIVEPSDVQGIVKILHRLVKDKDLRFQTGENARARVSSQFNVEKMLNEYQEIYSKNKGN